MYSDWAKKSKTDKQLVYKALLSLYKIGQSLKGKDFNAVLELLTQHPDAENKIGVGIKDLLVDDDGYGGKCFHLVRHDGTKESFSYLKCLGYKITPKSVKAVESKPAPKKSNVDKGVAKATAKSAKITLVLDPASITKIDSIGQKHTKLKITVEAMVFEVDLNSKSYRKALAAIDELGAENCNAILQGTMKEKGKIEGAGLAVQPKKAKENVQEELPQDN
jgi:hypothetical protein